MLQETNVILVPDVRIYALKQTTGSCTLGKPEWSAGMSNRLLYTDISVGTNRNMVKTDGIENRWLLQLFTAVTAMS